MRLRWTRFRVRLRMRGTKPPSRPKPAKPPAPPTEPAARPQAPNPVAPRPTALGQPAPPVPSAPDASEAPKRRFLRRPRLPRPHRPRLRLPRAAALPLLGLIVAGGIVAALIAIDPFGGGGGESPGPKVGGAEKIEVKVEAAQAAAELGFPAFATKNTTRVGGTEPDANSAGVALAVYPSAGGSPPPPAVTLVADDDWQGAIAASALASEPTRAPLLIGSGGGVPSATGEAISALDPQGAPETAGAAGFAIGDVDVPDGLKTTAVKGTDPATLAVGIDRLRTKLTHRRPGHIVIVSEDESAFAMPAAAWAARSGDPVLFARKDQLPKPTERALKAHKGVPAYVLGPSSVISSKVVRAISRTGTQVHRVSGEDPVSNAVEFARYADGSFGWNINDPGHGFVVARSDRPLDAAAASSLSASGTWGPLLLTDSASELPGALRGYLLDVKPGYRNDPTRALYNHVWVIGDEGAIDVNQQAAIDDLAELARIGGAPEQEASKPPAKGKK
jgi:hypothetical protein